MASARYEQREPSCPTASLGIDVLSDDKQIGNLTEPHSVQSRLAAKHRSFIRLLDPLIRRLLIRHQNLKCLVDPDYVRDALKSVSRENGVRVLLPLEEGRPGRPTQESYLIVNRQIP